jgi:hypothetical protein
MPAAPSDSDSPLRRRIAAVELSLRCFVYSLIGLVPLVGLPFAMAAIVRSRRAPKADTPDWNPADRYLVAARRLAPLGFLTTAVFLGLACVVLPAILRDWASCSHGSS